MISKQELQYVSNYARDIPFPGEDYAYDVINRISESLLIFKKKYEGKRYSLLLSNGEEICFEIKSKNLAHLLGIDYKTISTDINMQPLLNNVLEFNNIDKINSYAVLSRIIDNGDLVIENDANNVNKFLNYYKIMVKTSCFNKLSDFNEFNFGVINFNKDIYENNFGNRFLPNSTKFVFSQNDEALIPYCMMGLKNDNGMDIMIPETFMAPTNFKDFLFQQELVLPIQLLINDDKSLSKLVATSKDKIRILNLYKSLIFQYNTESLVDIFNDYETILRKDCASKRKVL